MLHLPLCAQEDKQPEPASVSVKKKSEAVVNSLVNDSEVKQAKKYEELALALEQERNFEKAEKYYSKALEIYQKLNRKEDVARISRSIAKIAESNRDIKKAVKYYDQAEKNVQIQELKEINQTDKDRLLIPETNEGEVFEKINLNIEKFRELKNEQELVDAYMQKSEIEINSKNYNQAIKTLTKASEKANTNASKVFEIQHKIGEIYAEQKEYDKAIQLHLDLLKKANETAQAELQVQEHLFLADLYAKRNDISLVNKHFEQAYQIAYQLKSTKLVQKIIQQITDFYQIHQDHEQQLFWYKRFFGNLNNLVHADSSLLDEKAFGLIEQRIEQLEKEKKLQTKLMEETSSFNRYLLVLLVILIGLIGLIIRSFLILSKKNKEIALQSLRREMNPHFIFNSLNSVNQYIALNKELEANQYLTSYSMLMRTMMENSAKDFIPLALEIDLILRYLKLEHQRFEDLFSYNLIVDEKIDVAGMLVPNMLLQPHIENAIWHGLRYLTMPGNLTIRITQKHQELVFEVEDNGIGIAKSKAMKTIHQRAYTSVGLKNVNERIQLLNDLYKLKIHLTIQEKVNESGTLVKISVPFVSKLIVDGKN